MNFLKAVQLVEQNENEMVFDMEPMEDIVNQLISMGYEVDEDKLETETWSVDFWLYVSKKDIHYVVTGSWYYGNYKFKKL